MKRDKATASAEGLEGLLLLVPSATSPSDEEGVDGVIEGYMPVIQVTNEDGSTTDYLIMHCDMRIRIEDDSAVIRQTDEGPIIDFSDEILGY